MGGELLEHRRRDREVRVFGNVVHEDRHGARVPDRAEVVDEGGGRERRREIPGRAHQHRVRPGHGGRPAPGDGLAGGLRAGPGEKPARRFFISRWNSDQTPGMGNREKMALCQPEWFIEQPEELMEIFE